MSNESDELTEAIEDGLCGLVYTLQILGSLVGSRAALADIFGMSDLLGEEYDSAN